MRQVIADLSLVALQSTEKRDVGDVRQGIFSGEEFPIFHFSIQGRQVAAQPLFRFLDLIIVRDVAGGVLQTRVAEVDPDARAGAQQGIFGHERGGRIFFLEIFVDDRRLVDHADAIYQYRNFRVGVKFQKIFRFIGKIALDEFERKFLFGQDNPCPVRVGSGLIGKELHNYPPR